MMSLLSRAGRTTAPDVPGPPNVPIQRLSIAWMDWLTNEGYLDGKWKTRKHMHLDFSDDLFKLISFFPVDFVWAAKRTAHPHRHSLRNHGQDEDEVLEVNVSKLISLDLSDNNLMDDMFDPREEDKRSLTGKLFTNLKLLKLSQNCLKYPVIILPQLKELYLSNNELVRMPPTSGLPELEVLVLDGNHIKKMSGSAITDLKLLRRLDVSDNQIDMRPSELSKMFVFLGPKKFPELTRLTLKENLFCNSFPEYQMLAVKCLKKLEQLDDIDLQGNKKLAEDLARQAETYFKFSGVTTVEDKDGEKEIRAEHPDEERLKEIDKSIDMRIRIAKGEQIMAAMQDGKKEFRKPKFRDLVELLDTALSDPSAAKACIDLVFEEACQIAESASKGSAGKDRQDADLSAFVQQSLLLIERVPESRITLLKSISKFAAVQDGVALAAVAQLATGGGVPISEIIDVLEEYVIPELLKTREQTFETCVVGLAKFDCESDVLAELFAKHHTLVEKFCDRLEPSLNSGQSVDMQDKEGPIQLALSELLRCAVKVPVNIERCYKKNLCYDLIQRIVPLQGDDKEITGDDWYSTQLYIHWSAILVSCISYDPEKALKEVFARDTLFHNRLVMLVFGPINRLRETEMTENMKCPECKKIGAIIRVLSAMMGNARVQRDFFPGETEEQIEEAQKSSDLLKMILKAPSETSADPLILGPSLAFLREAMRFLDHRKGQIDCLLKMVVESMGLLRKNSNTLFLQYIDSKKFKDLYKRCEQHMQQTSRNAAVRAGAASAIIPEYGAVTNVYVHETIVEIVKFIGFFSVMEQTEEADGGLATRVSENLNDNGRDTLVMKLLEIPSDMVRRAVIDCLRFVKTDQLEQAEFEQLLEMFNPDAVEQDEVLIGQVMSLFERLTKDENEAGDRFRARYARDVIKNTMECLAKNESRDTFGNVVEEAQKARLSGAAVALLWSASRHERLRPFLRTHDTSMQLRQIIKNEEYYHSHSTEDICIELTWIGRSVENLLGCLTGQDQLKPVRKQGFRLINRLADVMEGKTDAFMTSPYMGAAERGWQEAHMWNDHEMKIRLMYIDDDEFEDRVTQQQCFVSFQALGRLIQFLEKHPDCPKMAREEGDQKGQKEGDNLEKEMNMWTKEAGDSTHIDGLKHAAHGMLMGASSHVGRHTREILRRTREQRLEEEVPEIELDDDVKPVNFINIRHQLEYHGWNDLAEEDTMKTAIANAEHGPDTTDGTFISPQTARDYRSKLPHSIRKKEEIFIKASKEKNFVSMTCPFLFHKKSSSEADRIKVVSREFTNDAWRYLHESEKDLIGTDIPELPVDLHVMDIVIKKDAGVHYVFFFIDLHPTLIDIAELDAAKLLTRVYMMAGWKQDEDEFSTPTGFAIPAVPQRMRKQERLSQFSTNGQVPLVYSLAATLRSVYGVLALPAVERIRLDLIQRLRFVSYQSRLIALIDACGSDVHCNVAAKYMRVCSVALRTSPERTIIDLTAPEDHEYVICMSMAAHFAGRVLSLLTPLLMHFGRGYLLDTEQQTLCVEALRLLSSLVEVVPYIQMSDVRHVQLSCCQHFIATLVPMSVLRSVIVCLIYEMQVNVGSSHGPYINGKYVKSSVERVGLRELCSDILTAVIHLAPTMRYEVVETFYKFEVLGRNEVRVSFMSEMLANVELTKCRFAMETIVQERGSAHERILKCVHVDLPQKRNSIGFSIGLMSAKTQPRMLVVTNRRVLIMDYPKHGPMTRKCGYCPPESFCPIGPAIAEEHTYAELTRIVKGADPQMFALGWMKPVRDQLVEVFDVFICFRSDVRIALLQTLTTLSGPTIETRTEPEPDALIKQAALTKIERDGTTYIICMNWAWRQDGENYFVLFVLTATHLCQADIHFDQWMPPLSDGPSETAWGDDEGSFLGTSVEEYDVGLFSSTLKADKSKLKRVQRSKAQEWLAGEKDKPKRHLYAFWSTKSYRGEEALSKVMDDRKEARAKFNSNIKEKGKVNEAGAQQSRNALQLAMRKARQSIFKKWKQWPIVDLENIIFDPGEEALLTLKFGGKEPETIAIHFPDDTARERWRQGLAHLLNRSDNVVQWSRKWDVAEGETTI